VYTKWFCKLLLARKHCVYPCNYDPGGNQQAIKVFLIYCQILRLRGCIDNVRNQELCLLSWCTRRPLHWNESPLDAFYLYMYVRRLRLKHQRTHVTWDTIGFPAFPPSISKMCRIRMLRACLLACLALRHSNSSVWATDQTRLVKSRSLLEQMLEQMGNRTGAYLPIVGLASQS
jgi:hypothetical protein